MSNIWRLYYLSRADFSTQQFIRCHGRNLRTTPAPRSSSGLILSSTFFRSLLLLALVIFPVIVGRAFLIAGFVVNMRSYQTLMKQAHIGWHRVSADDTWIAIGAGKNITIYSHAGKLSQVQIPFDYSSSSSGLSGHSAKHLKARP
jgi:hypothetical protein